MPNNGTPPKAERNEEIYRLYLEGKGPTFLSSAYGVTRSKIKLIVRRKAVWYKYHWRDRPPYYRNLLEEK